MGEPLDYYDATTGTKVPSNIVTQLHAEIGDLRVRLREAEAVIEAFIALAKRDSSETEAGKVILEKANKWREANDGFTL